MLSKLVLGLTVMATLVSPLFANELDQETQVAMPKGVVVKVNPQTRQMEVFKLGQISKSEMKDQAAVEQTLSDMENNDVVESVQKVDLNQPEMDRETSTAAWYWYGYNTNWNYYYYSTYYPRYYTNTYFTYYYSYNYSYNYNYYNRYWYNGCYYYFYL